MTDKEERNVRAASKILRDLKRDDVYYCAEVLNLEAQILAGEHSDIPPIPRLVGMLRGTAKVLANIANVIENIKIQ